MTAPIVLGLSASLRNARSSSGAHRLRDEIAALKTREQLDEYLKEQANIHLDQFKAAGRTDGLPFDEMYRNLQRDGGQRGLSNSEIALVAALWGAQEKGSEIHHIPLPDHFPASGVPANLDELKAALRKADAIILSTPVYFGDRGSLAQQFIDMIRMDEDLQRDLEGKVYAGVAVGAKRNGGQETTLIYAMMDMLNLGFLAVGNDSDTTSQYGGTGHAGDIGTMPSDTYGINTAIGTGRRVGSVALQLWASEHSKLNDKPRVDFWVLQDRNGEGASVAAPFSKGLENDAQTRFMDMTDQTIRPCIACDICPIHVGPDEEYRCIIKKKDDGLVVHHQDMLWPDIIAPVVYSPRKRDGVDSVYQQFMERTRYLRRGDYVFTDHLVVPFVITEVGANEIMDIRLMTSFVRHHTVLSKPVIGYMHEGKLLNGDDVRRDLARALKQGRRLTVGRLATVSIDMLATQYRPVGYVLAQAKDKDKKTVDAREEAVSHRLARQHKEAEERLAAIDTELEEAANK